MAAAMEVQRCRKTYDLLVCWSTPDETTTVTASGSVGATLCHHDF